MYVCMYVYYTNALRGYVAECGLLIAFHFRIHLILMVVTWEGDLTEEEKLKVRESFRLNRHAFPTMFIATKMVCTAVILQLLPSQCRLWIFTHFI